MRTPQQVWEGIRGIFANFAENWIIVIEAVFLFLLIYFVLKTLYENNAKKLIALYVFRPLCTAVITRSSAHPSPDLSHILLLLITLFFLLLFTVELQPVLSHVAS